MRADFARLLKVPLITAAAGGSVAAPVWLLGTRLDGPRPAIAASASAVTVLRAGAPAPVAPARIRKVAAQLAPAVSLAPVHLPTQPLRHRAVAPAHVHVTSPAHAAVTVPPHPTVTPAQPP